MARMRNKHFQNLAACLTILLVAAPVRAGGRWYTYENCRLMTNAYQDGDSFHVRTRSAELVFRLYFVDAPECDASYPDRVQEQAEYWHISTNQTLALGRQATAFTRDFLKKRFTVHSRREDAMGRSEHQRFYAVVKTDDADLAEALVARGLARIYGMPADLPDGTSSGKEFGKLRGLERAARKQGLGGWGLAAKSEAMPSP